MKEILKKVVGHNDLSEQEAYYAMSLIMSGNSSDASIASYITALRMKGETADEITGSVLAMREAAVTLIGDDSLDIVGTGGDGHNTFNVSSVSSLVAAACGFKVAKHGNKSVSSKCGSADVFEALGVKIDIAPPKMQKVLDKIKIAFMYAPLYHSSMKFASNVRKELSIRTIFNIMGPLSNPAYAKHALIGVYNKNLVKTFAEVLQKLGLKSAIVVCGDNGLDEVNPSGATYVSELKDGNIDNYILTPKDFGMSACALEDIIGGDPQQNMRIALDILNGQNSPKTDTVIMNSAMAIKTVVNKPIKECAQMAYDAIKSGSAMLKLKELIYATNQ